MGPHPYLVGLSEGRAVLDAVRAARSLSEAHAGSRFAVWGYSQGGHATLFAALLARGYAPELHLVAVAAAAPASQLQMLLKPAPSTPDSQLLSAMPMWTWPRVYDLPLDTLVAPADRPALMALARVCFNPPLDSNVQPPAEAMPAVSYKDDPQSHGYPAMAVARRAQYARCASGTNSGLSGGGRCRHHHTARGDGGLYKAPVPRR